MPADLENYQLSGLSGPSTNERTIPRFLATTLETGYRAGEIAEALDIPRGSVGATLSRLHNQGFVRYKGEYWAINPDTYDVHTVSLVGLATMSEQFEGDYYDENPDWDVNLLDLDESEDADFGIE